MKKLISILLAALMIVAVALTLAGCGGSEAVAVTSMLKIDDSFHGVRTVTVRYPLSADIDAIKETILDESPSVEGVTFTYRGVEEDGYYFELILDFNSKDDYEREASAVIGRSATTFLSRKDSPLMRGTRMTENYGADDLIGWITRATAADSSTKEMDFDYAENTVVIGSETFSTGCTVDINQIEGSTVEAITVKTTNKKDDTYRREFWFYIPETSYTAGKAAFDQFFSENTVKDAAEYADWEPEGSKYIYKVIYDNLTLRNLTEYSSRLLDTDNVSIRYDRDQASTPLAQGLVYEESLDAYSFVGPEKGVPTIAYSYSIPSDRSDGSRHGAGTIFEDGKWVTAGEWGEDDVYRLEVGSGSLQIRLPDNTQYLIEGVDFHLESLGDERFRRTTDFLYDKKDGTAGRDYAVEFFAAKGADASAGEDDGHLICSVACEGTTSELATQLPGLFGNGNFMTYRKNSGTFSLSTKSTFTDYINLSSILTGANAEAPLRYYISASGAENIVSVSLDGDESAYQSERESFLTLSGPTATVEYFGSIPITSHIIIYVLVGLILLAATIFIAYALLHYRKPGLNVGAKKIMDAVGVGDEDDASLSQTTTFSIAELGALSRNKRYVDEINKDIEDRLEQDRLTERKKEIRRRELEEMERKVYGSDDKSPLDDVPELDISVLRAAVADTAEEPDSEPKKPEKPAEKQPEPAAEDPFSLLDDTEDEDDHVSDHRF